MRKKTLRIPSVWDHKFCLPGICNKNDTLEYWEKVAAEFLNGTKKTADGFKEAFDNLKKRLSQAKDKILNEENNNKTEAKPSNQRDMTLKML